MEALLFYIFAALTLICGLLVVANPFTRNPVTSAMFLVCTIISMAGLFVLLQAFYASYYASDWAPVFGPDETKDWDERLALLLASPPKTPPYRDLAPPFAS